MPVELLCYCKVQRINRSQAGMADDLAGKEDSAEGLGLGRSTANMLALADSLRARCANLRVLNLGGGNVDTGIPMGSMVFTVMAALAQMELEIKRERVSDSNTKRRAAGMDLGGRRPIFSDSQIGNARRLIEQGQPASHVARDLGMSRTTLYRRINNPDACQWLANHPAPSPLPINDTTITSGPSVPISGLPVTSPPAA